MVPKLSILKISYVHYSASTDVIVHEPFLTSRLLFTSLTPNYWKIGHLLVQFSAYVHPLNPPFLLNRNKPNKYFYLINSEP